MDETKWGCPRPAALLAEAFIGLVAGCSRGAAVISLGDGGTKVMFFSVVTITPNWEEETLEMCILRKLSLVGNKNGRIVMLDGKGKSKQFGVEYRPR